MIFQNREFIAYDGHKIRVCDWRPSQGARTKAVVQILHGLGEHAMRYDRFANECVARNLAVVAHDHRGHGKQEGYGHYADSAGWNKVIADVLQVRQDIALQYPKLPVILFGHSMGSYIAQSFVMRHGGNNAALILSATTLAARAELFAGHSLARILSAVSGRRRKSKLLNQLGLGNFNNQFQPSRTDYDWLSRDQAEVDRYINDPLCGGQYSNQLWSDLTGGLLEVASHNAISLVRSDMPVLIFGGEFDPAGGQRGLTRLADGYRRVNHENVELSIYPGGRHEMLNETNGDAVTADVISWIEQVLNT